MLMRADSTRTSPNSRYTGVTAAERTQAVESALKCSPSPEAAQDFCSFLPRHVRVTQCTKVHKIQRNCK